MEFDADGLPADLCRHALNIELGLHKPETPRDDTLERG